MRLDKLTTKFQQALADAQSLAIGHDNQIIEPQHLLLALLQQDDGSTTALLAHAGVNVAPLKTALVQAIGRLPKVEGHGGDVQVGRDLTNLLNLTDKEAQKHGDQFIASEMFLLALCDDKGECGRLLRQHGLLRPPLEQGVAAVRGGQGVESQDAEGQRQSLSKYCIDLTERARLSKLDPVIGRDDEIRRAIQILQRRTKNNPVLIGEPGVGKTAIVEGLAQRIVKHTLTDWALENVYEIYPGWRHRYAPGVTHNTEHLLGLCIPAPLNVTLAPREHTGQVWLPYREAADRCFSPSNAEAILLLPRFATAGMMQP